MPFLQDMGVYNYKGLDTGRYKVPTIKEESQARQFAKLRDEYSELLGRRIDDILKARAEELIEVALRYSIPAEAFTFDYNADISDDVDEIMEEAEAEIQSLLEKYATTMADNNPNYMQILLAYLALLGTKNRSQRETMQIYLIRFKRDIEAAIAALTKSKATMEAVKESVRRNLHNISGIPEVKEAFKTPMEYSAELIRDQGIAYDPIDRTRTRGVPTNGASAVINMTQIALSMTWSRWQLLVYKDMGAAGYYQMRSAIPYPCAPCDDEVGFHAAEDWENIPMPHPHCRCIRIPVYFINNGR